MCMYVAQSIVLCISFFFFQAEDGIRDIGVTGVQTCALPIFRNGSKTARFASIASKLTFSSVFAWEPSNYIKQTITSEKERFPGHFERKTTNSPERLRNGSKTPRFASFASKLTFLNVFSWEPSYYNKHTITSEKERSSGHFERKPNSPERLRNGSETVPF